MVQKDLSAQAMPANLVQQVKDLLVASVHKQTGIYPDEPKTTPDISMGDLAMPCFLLAKELKKSPAEVAQSLATAKLGLDEYVEKIEASGPYLNVFFKRPAVAKVVIETIKDQDQQYGSANIGQDQQVLLEFSSPNTNKPQHLGHVRNNVLGEIVAHLLKKTGYQVVKTCLINDRGIHICKSMLAYTKWGEGKTPESQNLKGDHFVGQWYVKFEQELEKERQAWYTGKNLERKTMTDQEKRKAENDFLTQSPLQQAAQNLLQRWENNDPEIRGLWQTMNNWVYQGFDQTYKRLGVSFEKTYYESQGSDNGKQIIMAAADKGIFKRDADGSITADLSKFDLPAKTLLRADGTTLYVTNDISLAQQRYEEYPGLAGLIYVVGSEQDLYFKQLFAILKLLDLPWTNNLCHLSYGMVNLPEGRMKSREGKVVDADDLMEEVVNLAKDELVKRLSEENQKMNEPEVNRRAETIGLAAIKIFTLKANRQTEITFDPKESIELTGRTGVNLLYTFARATSVLNKANEDTKPASIFFTSISDSEWKIIIGLNKYPDIIADAAKNYEPSILVNYLLDLAQDFNSFYHDQPVLKAEPDVRKARLALVNAFRTVMQNGLGLLGIEPLDEM